MDVAVDLRKNSKTFGKYYSIIISDKSEFSLFLKVLLMVFCVYPKRCTVHYKCSEYRHKESERTLNWKDKNVGVKWPVKTYII